MVYDDYAVVLEDEGKCLLCREKSARCGGGKIKCTRLCILALDTGVDWSREHVF
jgi:hypothetical protein